MMIVSYDCHIFIVKATRLIVGFIPVISQCVCLQHDYQAYANICRVGMRAYHRSLAFNQDKSASSFCIPVAACCIFSRVRPINEQAVSNLDTSMHRSPWVQVTHSSFIERSHTTKIQPLNMFATFLVKNYEIAHNSTTPRARAQEKTKTCFP